MGRGDRAPRAPAAQRGRDRGGAGQAAVGRHRPRRRRLQRNGQRLRRGPGYAVALQLSHRSRGRPLVGGDHRDRGAVGGGVGNKVGGGVGAAVGGGAGAAVGSKSQGGSNRNATYSGVGGAVGSAVGKSIFGGNAGAAIGGAIGGGAGAAIEQDNRRR